MLFAKYFPNILDSGFTKCLYLLLIRLAAHRWSEKTHKPGMFLLIAVKPFDLISIEDSEFSFHISLNTLRRKDVYEEILSDINTGAALYADETGWRIQGRNWWLWVFGTEDSAYFTIDRSRGSNVVRRVLGEIFLGVLVVDGWGAYWSIICEQQTCMAHLFRKIRKFRDAFPDLVSIAKFYVKLRRIIRDGERLQKNRQKVGEMVFQRRLQKLENRLECLIKWPNPNDLLKEIIKKVKKQQPRILAFVEHKKVKSHNNFAELLIRKGVLKRKVSGGSKSPKGASAYAVLLSIHVTCGLRGISFSAFIKESLKQYIKTGKPMLLKEYQKITNGQKIILLKAA